MAPKPTAAKASNRGPSTEDTENHPSDAGGHAAGATATKVRGRGRGRGAAKKVLEPYIKKWQIYAHKRGIDPVHLHVSFMTKLISSNISYSSLCTARSALSCVIDTNSDTVTTFGSLPEVKRLMKGAFEIKPSYPESSKATTWDPNIVLNYLKNLYPNKHLNLKELKLKVVTLLALCTGQRLQTLQKLNTNNMTLCENKCSFIITDKHTQRPSLKTNRTFSLPQ